eukprot:COSAG02_NODE_18398_length_941_cov_1.169834_2_plen_24_part_01
MGGSISDLQTSWVEILGKTGLLKW